MEDLIVAIVERVGAMRVYGVWLEVGRAARVSTESLRVCFGVCARGTVVENAVLNIVETDGTELRVEKVEVA